MIHVYVGRLQILVWYSNIMHAPALIDLDFSLFKVKLVRDHSSHFLHSKIEI